ncbi:MAG: hypothetical protein Q9181_001548 [Wetmoreana brouardii]
MMYTYTQCVRALVFILQLHIFFDLSSASPPGTLSVESSLSRGTIHASDNANLTTPALKTTTSPLLTSSRNGFRVFAIDVPGTNVALEFILFEHRPINRLALKLAIETGHQWLEKRLIEKGDDWLAPDDDPFISFMMGKCVLRIDSVKAPSGRSRLTYRTLLSVYEGYHVAFISERNERQGTIRIKVADIIAGHGSASTEHPKMPITEEDMASTQRGVEAAK